MDFLSIRRVSASFQTALASLTPDSFCFDLKSRVSAAMSRLCKPSAAEPATVQPAAAAPSATEFPAPSPPSANTSKNNNNSSNKDKVKKRPRLSFTLLRRNSAAVEPRCPSPTDSAHGSIQRPASPALLSNMVPAAYRPPAYGSSSAPALDLVTQVPEFVTHSLAVVERWLVRCEGVYRIQMSTADTNALVESFYDPATGARLASAPIFDVDAPETRQLAGAYAHLVRTRLRRARVGVLPISTFDAVVDAHQGGAHDVATIVSTAAAKVGHERVLRVVFAHLAKVTHHSHANSMTGESLLRVWTMALLAADGADLSMADLARILKHMGTFCAALGPLVECCVDVESFAEEEEGAPQE